MKRRKLAKGTLVQVFWLDAVTHPDGWDTLDENDMVPDPVLSVGFVLGSSVQSITIAADVAQPPKHTEGHTNRAITIPWAMVQDVEEIE